MVLLLRSTLLIVGLIAAWGAAQQVPADCQFVHVSGAGTAVVNGWYNFAGIYERKFYWCRDGKSCSYGMFSVSWSVRNKWAVIDRDRLYLMEDGIDPAMPVGDEWSPVNQGRPPAPVVTCHKERTILPTVCPFVSVSGAGQAAVNGVYEPSTLFNSRRSWKQVRDPPGAAGLTVYLALSSSGLWVLSLQRYPRVSDALYIEPNLPSSGGDLPARANWAAHSANAPAPVLACHAAPPHIPAPTPASGGGPGTPGTEDGRELELSKPLVSSIEFSKGQYYVTKVPASVARITVTVEFSVGDLEVYMCCQDTPRKCPSLRDYDVRSPDAEPSPIVLAFDNCRVVRTMVYAFFASPKYTITARVPTQSSVPSHATLLPVQKTFLGSALPDDNYAFFRTPVESIRVVHVVVMARQPFGIAASTRVVARMNATPGYGGTGVNDGTDSTSDQGTMACIEIDSPEDGQLYVGITGPPRGSRSAPFQLQVVFNKRTTCRSIKSGQFPVFD